jgi:hypothetical protein
LSAGTTYHFRLVATNAAGTSVGGDQTFATLVKPSVTTGSATSVGETSGTLNGSVDPNGSTTTYHFEYGPTTSYGSQSPAVDASAGSGSSPVAVSTSLSGLSAGTTYHFRLVATNPAGLTFGADQTLTTSSDVIAGPEEPPATTSPVTTSTSTPVDGGTPAQTANAAASRCAPTLAVGRQRRASVLRHGLRISVGCLTAGSVAASLVADRRATKRLHLRGRKPIVVARARRTLTAPASVRIALRLRPARRVRLALARTTSVALKLKVVVTDANGVRHVLTQRVSIRR